MDLKWFSFGCFGVPQLWETETTILLLLLLLLLFVFIWCFNVYLLCKCAVKQLNHVKPMYFSYFILRRSRKHAGGLLGVQMCSSQIIFWFVMRLLFWLVWVRLHVPLFRLFDGHSVLFLLALVGVTESWPDMTDCQRNFRTLGHVATPACFIWLSKGCGHTQL